MMRRRLILVLLLSTAAIAAAAPAAAAKHANTKPGCVVPRLTGDSLAVARLHLVRAHCRLGTLHRPAAHGKLVVRHQSPRPHAHRKHGAPVTLWMRIQPAPTPTPTPTPTTTGTTPTPMPPAPAPTPTPTPAPAPTPAPPVTTTPAPSLTPTYLENTVAIETYTTAMVFNATLTYSTASEPVLYLIGQPVTYTIVDLATDQMVATFPGISGSPSGGCAVSDTLDATDTILTLVGAPLTEGANVPACDLGTVQVPFADPLSVQASFAGNSTYAASTSSTSL